MANVALLLFRQCATLSSAFAAAVARSEQGNAAETGRTDRRDSVSAMSILRAVVIVLSIADFTDCATIPQHQFAEPTSDWQVRSGQLLYRTSKMTLIGDVLIRVSQTGDCALTFSKGLGVLLQSFHQDARFAELKG